MKEEKIRELVDEMIEVGDKPYAIFCNKKTFEILAKELRKLDRFREFDNIIPLEMSVDGLPVIKNEYIDDSQILVVDKNTYEKIMDQKTITYHRKGMLYDFGKKTIIKRIG